LNCFKIHSVSCVFLLMSMVKKLFIIIINLIAILYLVVAEAAPIENLRTSTTPARVRIVLDSKAAIKYKVAQGDKLLVVDLPQSSAKRTKPVITDSVIQSVSLSPTGKNSSQLQIKLSKRLRSNIFTLANPCRLVIDLNKIEKLDRKQRLQTGVDYRFIQDELDGWQYRAYIVAISPDARYELRPFSAAGTYNGRGSLMKRTVALGLPVAINASYFDSDGWVIGVTKDKGKLISSEEVPHSAFITKWGKSAIVKDVAYSGYLELKNGQRITIKGMNRARITEDCVLYNEAYARSTKTNQWGREIKLKNNLVISVSTLGNMNIEPGTVVISGHGANALALAGIRVGDRLKLVEALGNSDAAQAETVVGAGPLLLEKGTVKVCVAEEQIANDIARGRAPRTAVGIKADGTVLLVVVDGRSADSYGMSLEELARFLQRLGAVDGVNLDGGGSSEMIVNGRIVNRPSDGRERFISMGLGLFPK